MTALTKLSPEIKLSYGQALMQNVDNCLFSSTVIYSYLVNLYWPGVFNLFHTEANTGNLFKLSHLFFSFLHKKVSFKKLFLFPFTGTAN